MSQSKTNADVRAAGARTSVAIPRALPDKSERGDSSLAAALESLSQRRVLLLIFLVAFLAYANAVGGEFVFDDTEQIVTNQNLRSWSNLTRSFTTHVWGFRDQQAGIEVPPPLPYYRPLFTVLLTLEYHLFGLWPQGWHLASLALHAAAAGCVFYVISLLSRRRLVALFAALLFAVHPVHAESVSWISGVTDPLYSVFFLASFAVYLKSRNARGSKMRPAAIAVGLFVISAYCKETALSLVLLVFGYEFLEAAGGSFDRMRQAARNALPFAAASLVYLIPRYLVLGELMWTNPQAPDRPIPHTFLTVPFVIVSYLFHMIWPVGLSVTYNTRFITTPASPMFLLPAAALTAFAAALFAYRKRIGREVWICLLLIFAPLLPVLKLGQVSREEYLVFDHYLYLPVAGFAYLVAIALARLAESGARARASAQRMKFGLASMAVILAVSIVVTAGENRAWAGSYALWSKAARVRPAYWAPHYNAGLALLDEKRFDEASVELNRAAELRPDEPDVFDALGRACDAKSDKTGAIANFRHALDLDPQKFESLNNLGHVYFESGDYGSAQRYFEQALEARPGSPAVLYNQGLCLSRQGRYSDAITRFERVLNLAPGDGETYYELGMALEKSGRRAEAISALRRAGDVASSQALADKAKETLVRLQKEF